MKTAMQQKANPSEDSYLSLCTIDMTAKKYDPVIGRDKEVDNIIEILCRKNKANPILIGDPGVGKTAVIQELANRIQKGNVPQKIINKRIRSLDLTVLSKHIGAIKFTLDEIVKAGDILFIDEIHNIVGAGKTSGSLDVANVMKPLLTGGNLTCIGATTLEEYKLYFEKDAALERRFNKVLIEEPSEKDALNILRCLKEKYEEHHNVLIDGTALETAVTYSIRYLTDRQLPDKAFDILDEACSKKSLYNNKIEEVNTQIQKYQAESNWEKVSELTYGVLPELEKRIESKVVSSKDILEVISNKTGIPVTKMNQSEREKLLNLEKHLQDRVIGQDQALKVLANSIRTTRVGLNKDTTSVLFLGNTGVGKTEAAKALAELLFDNENALVRLDMSEYKEAHSIAKLIGPPAGYVGYEEGGQLTEAVKRKPYSVILLDEVEKAHPEVWDIFLQVFDDGRLTDNKGRTIDFKNTIIIMTSNLKENNLKNFFRVEFLNRISSIVTFNDLDRDTLRKIVIKQLNHLSERLVKSNNIELGIKDDLLNFLVDISFKNRELGARPIKRYIKDKLETFISNKILENDSLKGNALILSLSEVEKAA